ncbi:MAG: DUF1570 domain-containing protein [Kofleriaceae bacterium]
MRLSYAVAVLGVFGCTTGSPEPKSNAVPRGDVAIAASGRRDSFTQVEYGEHIAELRARLRKQGLGHLNVRIEDPFVVVGDSSLGALARSSGTVRWAADKLEQDFFDKRPTKILDIYLFATAESYETGVLALTGEAPSTPYGFYSSTHGAMFMNIATGGGTLVHEIVHPYVEADFPSAPAWLNEGLGSLFEQSAERDGRIVGLTNWRLGGLQRTIERGRLQAFSTLTHLPHTAFYGDETGTNYAQSRYLMYYLQEQGKLREFYQAFRDGHDRDPTGYKTLTAALDARDMAAFTRRWERYVMDLEFP